MEIRPLCEVLNGTPAVKMGYIRGDLSQIVNEQQRGASGNYKNLVEIYKHIFNPNHEKPRGELSELKSAIVHGKEVPACLGELADFLYYAIGLDRGLSLSEERGLSMEAFRIGKCIGLKPYQVMDGCIIKYHSRATRRKKDISHELKALEDYLSGSVDGSMSRMQKRRAIKAIAQIIKKGPDYLKLIVSN